MSQEKPIDFSQVYLVEGTVEQDPLTDRHTIHSFDPRTKKGFSFDPDVALGRYKGQEVRLIIAPLAHIEEIEKLVAQQNEGGGESFVVDPLLPKKGSGQA